MLGGPCAVRFGSRRSRGIRQLIEIQPPVERAFLVGAPRKGSAEATQVEDHLDELRRLADTAGAEVVGKTHQRVEAPTPTFYLGQGKVEELKGVLQDTRSTLVLFDEPLSPVQGTNLEKALAVRVMDRTEVILDIFATLDTLTREVDVGEGYRFRVSDTVGFIRKLPHHLVASFRATLEEAREADLLLHVIDAAQPGWEEQVEVVESVLGEMGLYDSGDGPGERRNVAPERKRTIYVFNKADLLAEPEDFLARVRERYPHAVVTSARLQRAGLGVERLRGVLRTSAQALRPIACIRVPIEDGKLLAALHRDAEVMTEVQMDGVVEVTARVQAWLLGKLRREGVDVVLGGSRVV